ncbi:hypothetical protein AMTRI_Chr11g152120 [Amborella trichopoda]
MLSRVERLGHFSGFNIANSGIVVSHLQYADNTLIFCDVNPLHVRTITRFLEVCEVTIGFKVNFNKSSMVGINCSEALTASLASVMECKEGSFPLTYLRLPISNSRLTIVVWDKVLKRIQFKLDLWKNKHMSLGGRVTLLRSCLSNLLVYQMSLINMPASVARKIEKMMRDFLWGSHGDSKKFNLLRWERVCTPKKEDDLGIRRIRFINQALLCKWWWRSIHFKDHLWYQVILSKYGLDRSELWLGGGAGRNTSKKWRSIANCRPMISGYFRWNVGCGDKVSFWHHKWVDEFNLKSLFPELFGIVSRPNIKVSEAIELRVVNMSWDSFLGYNRLNNELLSQWRALMQLLDNVYISPNADHEYGRSNVMVFSLSSLAPISYFMIGGDGLAPRLLRFGNSRYLTRFTSLFGWLH